jgi:hypothetical protein
MKFTRSPLKSTGICWNLLESTGVHWNPLESTGIHWTLPVPIPPLTHGLYLCGFPYPCQSLWVQVQVALETPGYASKTVGSPTDVRWTGQSDAFLLQDDFTGLGPDWGQTSSGLWSIPTDSIGRPTDCLAESVGSGWVRSKSIGPRRKTRGSVKYTIVLVFQKILVLSIYILYNIYGHVPCKIWAYVAVPFLRYQWGGGGGGVCTKLLYIQIKMEKI